MTPTARAREAVGRLEGRIRSYGAERVVVAFSGGVDSSVVLAMAARALGQGRVTGVTAISPSYPAGELEEAAALADSMGVAHRVVETGEVERESYARNDFDRCFHCKMELYATLRRVFATAGGRPELAVLAGANADDPGDFRPGLAAAERHFVRNPLLEEGVGKDLVRAVARWLALPVADKPALACLSSRIAHGVRITPDLLSQIDRAEQAVRALGFGQVRVRHMGEEASIEVAPVEVGRLTTHPQLQGVIDDLRALGWQDVVVDPRGYRTGSLNPVRSGESLGPAPATGALTP